MVWFSSMRCGDTELEKFMPKPPWQTKIDDLKLQEALNDARQKGIDIPTGVIIDG